MRGYKIVIVLWFLVIIHNFAIRNEFIKEIDSLEIENERVTLVADSLQNFIIDLDKLDSNVTRVDSHMVKYPWGKEEIYIHYYKKE